jgi:hypothetical protein
MQVWMMGRVAGLALEHTLGVAGGNDYRFGLNSVGIVVANVIARRACDFAIVQVEIGSPARG